MPTNPDNRDKLEIAGTFTGSVDKDFKVKVAGSDNNETWTYQTRTGTSPWGTASNATAIVVDSVISLEDGVTIKFTHSNKNKYTAGDIWVWSCSKDLTLSDNENQYDYLETINIEGDNNLIAISKTSGHVAVVNGIDTDTPNLEHPTINIGGSGVDTTLDIEAKNKELYISKGKDNPPMWLGYTKNTGWEGEGSLEIRAEKALDVIESSDNPESDAFDKSVTLRAGGGADSGDAKVIVGINTESDRAENTVFIMNIEDNKLLKFPCTTTPIMIKKWYGSNTGSSDYYCDGFAVMREPEQPTDACTIDLWNLNSSSGNFEGQGANLYRTFHVESPEDDYNYGIVESFSDFLIVPKLADFSSASQKYTLVLARSRGRTKNWSGSKARNYEWLWKTNEQSLADFEANTTIAKTSLEVITPETTYDSAGIDAGTRRGNEWYFLAKFYSPEATNGIDYVSVHSSFLPNHNKYQQYILETPRLHSLEFCGWDTGGANPIIGFTARLKSPSTYFETYDWTANIDTLVDATRKAAWEQVASKYISTTVCGPFLNDGASSIGTQKYHAVRWVTFFQPISDTNTGKSKQKTLLHTWDYETTGNNEAHWFNISTGWQIPEWIPEVLRTDTAAESGYFSRENVPAKNPLFGTTGRFICTGKEDGTRRYLSYVRGGSRKFLTFRFGEETAKPLGLSDKSKLNMFPNAFFDDVKNAYVKWNGSHADYPTNNSETYPITAAPNTEASIVKSTTITGAGSSDDKLSYRLSEGPFQIDQVTGGGGTAWYPKAAEKQFICSVPIKSHAVRQLFKARMDGGATTTNEFTSGNATFLLDTPVATGSDGDWAGPTMKKAFYKASFVYDGYQESALVSATNSIYDSNGLKKTYNVKIKVKDTFNIPKRITAIALYRAISSTEDTTEPESLYRFVQEIPLFQFNHDDTNGWWHYTVNDTGDAEGTYEAINGMSEKIYNLHINYGVNTQQNGYMFVGNCNHNEVEDAENYVFRSQPGKYSIFDWSKDFIHLPFIPVAMKGFMGKIYIFSETQMAVVNPENLYIEDIVEGIGCISPKSIMVTDTGMLWADYKQIYRASPAITPIGNNILNVSTYGWLNLSNDVKESIRVGYDAKRKAYLMFFTVGSDYRCWSYSTTKGRWDLWETPSTVKDTSQTKDGSCILLLSDNRIAKFLSHPSNNLNWTWESKRLSLGNTMLNKKIRNMKVEGNSRPKIGLKYKVPENYDSWQTGTDISSSHTGSNNTAIKIADSDKGKLHWLKLQITGDNGVAGADIKAYASSVIFKSKRPK